MRSEQLEDLPTLRILHHMARSGGTVICRCLASMENVVLLSEIHPLGVNMFNPLHQAHSWYNLLSETDVRKTSSGELHFLDAIQLISARCQEQGKTLVIRDWSHLDFTGVPFVRPAMKSMLAEVLSPAFRLIRYSTVRHPLDQWLSLSRQEVFREKLGAEAFLQGAWAFAEMAQTIGHSRFEEFSQDPDRVLTELCARLDLSFDPGYSSSWAEYTNITGDVLPGRAGSKIEPLPRQNIADFDADQFTRWPAYSEITRLLGYER